MNDNGKLLGTLMLGMAAGAAIGLLFAPEKGSEIRSKISDGAEDLASQLNEKFGEGKRALTDLKERAMGKADQLKDVAKREMNNFEHMANSTTDGKRDYSGSKSSTNTL